MKILSIDKMEDYRGGDNPAWEDYAAGFCAGWALVRVFGIVAGGPVGVGITVGCVGLAIYKGLK